MAAGTPENGGRARRANSSPCPESVAAGTRQDLRADPLRVHPLARYEEGTAGRLLLAESHVLGSQDR